MFSKALRKTRRLSPLLRHEVNIKGDLANGECQPTELQAWNSDRLRHAPGTIAISWHFKQRGSMVAQEPVHVHNAFHSAFLCGASSEVPDTIDSTHRLIFLMEPVLTIFLKIINREIPADIVYEDDKCLAFRDVSPQAPVHVLLIPKKSVVSLNELGPDDDELCAHLLLTVPKIAEILGLDGGYRTVVNTGADGGQSVFHLHIHILGGRPLAWPPG